MLTSLYVHIPFCDHICTYCDFHKSLASEDKKERYIKAVVKELYFRQDDLVNIKTIYIGGGTPLSLSNRLIKRLLSTIRKVVNMDNVVEFTIETNPNNVTDSMIDLLLQYGVNRISVGVQTFDPIQLEYLGRDHNISDIDHAIALLHQKQFPNISVDLIFSLVEQSLDDVNRDLDKVLSLDVDHISYYALILEEKTILFHQYQDGVVEMNDEDLEVEMFDAVIERLTSAGYEHYEISNFAKPGKQSQHNKAYWLNHEYLGIGSGAHSHVQSKRFYHIPSVSSYIKRIEQDDMEYYHSEDVDDCADRLLVGLRLTTGIDMTAYEQDCGMTITSRYPEVVQHIDNGLLEIVDNHLRLTAKGIRLGNIVFMTFLEGF